MKRLLNVEIVGDNIGASKIVGAVRRTDVEEVQYAMGSMKNGKTNGPFGVGEMLKAIREPCLISVTAISSYILFEDKLSEKRMLSLLVPVFKGKGEPLDPNSL